MQCQRRSWQSLIWVVKGFECCEMGLIGSEHILGVYDGLRRFHGLAKVFDSFLVESFECSGLQNMGRCKEKCC